MAVVAEYLDLEHCKATHKEQNQAFALAVENQVERGAACMSAT
jgi:hypothetical protein